MKPSTGMQKQKTGSNIYGLAYHQVNSAYGETKIQACNKIGKGGNEKQIKSGKGHLMESQVLLLELKLYSLRN